MASLSLTRPPMSNDSADSTVAGIKRQEHSEIGPSCARDAIDEISGPGSDKPESTPGLAHEGIPPDTVVELADIGPSNGMKEEAEKESTEFNIEVPVDEFPDKLNFRPLVLRTWFLCTAIVFHAVIFALLLTMCIESQFNLINEWAYFVVQILPLLIGTLTAATLESVGFTLSRITPFLRCASPKGDTLGNTLLTPYMPFIGFMDSIRTKNCYLLFSHILQYGGGVVLGMKAALLTSSYWDLTAKVTLWTVIALTVIYFFIIWYFIFIWSYLSESGMTGLREDWDVITMADHLTLFRHSNLVDAFDGSCIATRSSLFDVLGKVKVKLSYWKRKDGARWFGFRAIGVPPDKPETPGKSDHLNSDRKLSLQELSQIRFNSAIEGISTWWIRSNLLICSILLVGYIVALGMGASRETRNVFNPSSIPPSLGSFLFSFLATFFSSQLTIFWEDMYLFTIITQPFAEMCSTGKKEVYFFSAIARRFRACFSMKKKDESTSSSSGDPSGALAENTLLLQYTGMPRYVAMFEALTRSHWKIFRTALFALLQRIVPIVVGASITVMPPDNGGSGCSVTFSTPLSIIAIIWMAVYLFVIPYELLESGYTRHLTRANLTIGDLLSWTCSSSLLREDNIHNQEDEDHPPETGLLAGNPLDVEDSGRMSQKWYMEARLRLAQIRFSFGLEEIPSKKGKFTMGIKTSQVATPLLSRKSHGWRKGIGRPGTGTGTTGDDAATETDHDGRSEDEFVIAGAGRFRTIGDHDRDNLVGVGGATPAIAGENTARGATTEPDDRDEEDV